MKWILLIVSLVGALSGCGGVEGLVEFLHEPPQLERLPGKYFLDPKKYSYSSLKVAGYSDLSATLTLNADGSFSVTRLPDCCIYGESGFFGGYFEGSGTWKTDKRSEVFDLRLNFSTLRHVGPTRASQPTPFTSMSLTITKGTPHYGLAAPLFEGGDFVYAYFRKKSRE